VAEPLQSTASEAAVVESSARICENPKRSGRSAFVKGVVVHCLAAALQASLPPDALRHDEEYAAPLYSAWAIAGTGFRQCAVRGGLFPPPPGGPSCARASRPMDAR